MRTPRELLDLALSRHRQPWNFTVQACALPCFVLALLLHSAVFASMSIILVGAGFFALPMPAMQPGPWRRTVDRCIAAEVMWLNTPMNWIKLLKTVMWSAILAFAVWALWVGEMLSLGLLVCMGAVYKAYLYNKTTGIDA